jgi:hypothetical protein
MYIIVTLMIKNILFSQVKSRGIETTENDDIS